MRLIDLIREKLVSSKAYEDDKNYYDREQIYARILLYANSPNRFFYDLDILHDELYKLKTFVFDILQGDIIIHIVVLGYFDENFTHFCDVIIKKEDCIITFENDQSIPWAKIVEIFKEYLDETDIINVYGLDDVEFEIENVIKHKRY